MQSSESLPKVFLLAKHITGNFGPDVLKHSGITDDCYEGQLVILDNAAGTGIITAHLIATLPDQTKEKMELTCLEIAPVLVRYLKQRIRDENWVNVSAIEADAQSMPLNSNKFTHVFIAFGPMFFKRPESALRESYRVLQNGGTLTFSTWSRVGWYQDMKEAFSAMVGTPPFPTEEDLLNSHTDDQGYADMSTITATVSDLGFTHAEVVEKQRSSILSLEDYLLMHKTVVELCTRRWPAEERHCLLARTESSAEEFMRRKYATKPITWHWRAFITSARKPHN